MKRAFRTKKNESFPDRFLIKNYLFIGIVYFLCYTFTDMRSERLFEILFILLNKKRTTAHELAKKFAVSPRTVYRDIDILSCAGIPLYTMQGTGGGKR